MSSKTPAGTDQVGRCHPMLDNRGNALVVTLLITLALTGLVLGSIVSTTTETRLSSNRTMEEKAFYMAERGIEESIASLAGMGSPLMGSGVGASGPVPLVENKTVEEGQYSTWADPLDKTESSANSFVALTTRAVLDGIGVSKAVRVKLAHQSFACFAYFTDEEHNNYGSDIWFNTWDEYFGPVHTNDILHIDGSPVFHDLVSSHADFIDYKHNGPPTDDPVFDKGVELNADYIGLPEDLSGLLALSLMDGGHYFNNDTSIELFVTAGEVGKMRVKVKNDPEMILDLPENGVAYVDGVAEVWGTLKGQLSIACSSDMVIMDNILYYTDPRQDPTSTDVLGLLSESDVELDASPHGPNVDLADETVMGAIMALQWSFKGGNSHAGSTRGKIVVYGGVAQKKRGPFGTYTGSGNILTGWEEDWHWDPRLGAKPPPGYPTTGQVVKVSWQEIDPSSELSENVW